MAFASKRYNVVVQGVTVGTMSLSAAFDGYDVPIEKLQEMFSTATLAETQATAVDELLSTMFEAKPKEEAKSSDPTPF